MTKIDVGTTELVSIRDYSVSDKPFIMATWLKGLRFGNMWYTLIDDKVYYRVYHAILERLLSKPGVTIKVACLREEPDVILGYSVFEGPKLHWVQVKQAWRNIGIGKNLTPVSISTVTHLTEVGKAIFLKRKWSFDPFLLL